MQLNKLIIEPRVRSAWAAIDLGTLLARQFWWRGVALYLVLATPVFILLRYITDTDSWIPYICIWWLKPLFERPFLYSLSRELFSERMSLSRTLSNYKEWLYPSILQVLTLRRISPNRGMYAPVSLLEQPNAATYSKRTSVLGYKYGNGSTWLTIVFYHLESFLALATLVFLAFLFPEQAEDSLRLFSEKDTKFQIITDLCLFLSMVIIAPFYCAAGFCLYICRRIELEGWDIEICFRDWMRHHTPNTLRESGANNG